MSANTNEPQVKLQTSMGDIVVKLYSDTPQHRDNFVKLVNEGFYDGVLFHRIIADFMIQAGDPQSKTARPGQSLGSGDVGYKIPAEFVYPKYYHKKGALSAARQGDQVNPQRQSSGCQFYIVQGRPFTDGELDMFERRMGLTFTPEQRNDYTTIGGTPHLDTQYSVFGEVVSGLDIVDKIAKVQTGNMDRPVEDVKIIKATIVK